MGFPRLGPLNSVLWVDVFSFINFKKPQLPVLCMDHAAGVRELLGVDSSQV